MQSSARLVCVSLAVLSCAVALETRAQPKPRLEGVAPPAAASGASALVEPLAPVPLGTEFTYQGQLKSAGAAVNGLCDFVFRLYDADAGGSLLGSQSTSSTAVSGGLFTVTLDMADLFKGEARWLDIQVGCPSGTAPTHLLPRQKLTAVPHALTLRPGASIAAASTGNLFNVLNSEASSGRAAYFRNVGGSGESGFAAVRVENAGASFGLYSTSLGGIGVYGIQSASTGANAGVLGQTYSTDAQAVGVLGEAIPTTSGSGAAGVRGENHGTNNVGYGVYGSHDGNGVGVSGYSATGYGVKGGAAYPGSGVYGGGSLGGTGVHASSDTGKGVYSISVGVGINNPAVYAINAHGGAEPSGIAIYAQNGSGDATIVARNSSTGDVFRAFNAAGNALVFRLTNTGNVYADGSYNCGLGSGCFNTGSGADLAERIDAQDAVEPGDVIEIVPGARERYRKSGSATSRLVAGVVSTSPAITMNNDDLAGGARERTDARPLIALVGVVPVKASAENGPIDAGDLLVSASVPGHAMRAGDAPATGTVIGKALSPLGQGTGTVSMLVMLR